MKDSSFLLLHKFINQTEKNVCGPRFMTLRALGQARIRGENPLKAKIFFVFFLLTGRNVGRVER
jgi:hypothetical protein